MSASECCGDGVQSKPLGAARDSWIIDRLNVNAIPIEEHIRQRFAANGIGDEDRHDMAWAGHYRNIGGRQARLQGMHALLVTLALD